ncbi:hypothetical protein WISP_00193 [Willisornis vidua]|uniref:Rna-directed dna polymerase from mobile element jockey-like n=1 Tax=Willisornis vidua TaxID=1566151 RepID=A0ABQ9CPQ0_9PASS|nr:hypothetical protein WISP_00193 [Willisornis vidua]
MVTSQTGTEVLGTSFASGFNTDYRLRWSLCPKLEDHDCENDQLSVDPEIVQDLLLQLDPYKSMGPDEIHPRILKELMDVITKPLLMIFEWSWESGEIPADWKLENAILIFKKGKKKDPGNYRPVSLTTEPGKVMEKIILGSIEKHVKPNAVIGHSQGVFMKGKSCLTNLISFYDKVTHVVQITHSSWLGFMNEVLGRALPTLAATVLVAKKADTE